jgi:hypothetical protein
MKITLPQPGFGGQQAVSYGGSPHEQAAVVVAAQPAGLSTANEVSLSAEALAAQQLDSTELKLRSHLTNDPLWHMIQQLVKKVTGHDISAGDIHNARSGFAASASNATTAASATTNDSSTPQIAIVQATGPSKPGDDPSSVQSTLTDGTIIQVAVSSPAPASSLIQMTIWSASNTSQASAASLTHIDSQPPRLSESATTASASQPDIYAGESGTRVSTSKVDLSA